jgi:hypothetical protein
METRQTRFLRSNKLAELNELERELFSKGMISDKRCGSAKTLHGRETRAKRSETVTKIKIMSQEIRRWLVNSE